MSKVVKVIIADDHPIILLGLKEIICKNKNISVVGEATCSTETVELLKEQKPDILITDFYMPNDNIYGDGFKMLDYIIRNFPFTKVIVLTMLSNHLILKKLTNLGVTKIILKSNFQENITRILNDIFNEKNEKNEKKEKKGKNEKNENSTLNLTIKEYEVLRLFITGLSLSEIASRTNRSIKTISHQKISAMRKLGFDNDQALIHYCIYSNFFN